MNEQLLIEFSLLYKRLTIIEYTLKKSIIDKYYNFYGDNAYKILYRYFKLLDEQRNERIKTFEDINSSRKNNKEKLNLSINKMYLRETLLLFSNHVFTKNKIRKSFWNKEIDVKSSIFQKNQKSIKELRNCIAHFNTKKYIIEKTKFIAALIYFEQLLECKENIITEQLIKHVKLSKKLSIKNILEIIFKADKNYMKNDKLLIPTFDDIAILNGYTYSNLPQRWSIIRQKYELEGKLKINDAQTLVIEDEKTIQLNLFE